MSVKEKRAFRRWMALLLLLLAAGLLLLGYGLWEYQRGFHAPRGAQTAIIRCIPRKIVA